MIYFRAGLGAGAAVQREVLMRIHPQSYPWYIIFFSLFVTYCLWNLLRSQDIIAATILYTTCTALSRIVAATIVLHEPVSRGTWIGFGFMLLANICKRFL